jgi:Sec-independent protein translocase protein TatA
MMPLALLGNLGPWGLMILAAIALLFFGNRLPDVVRNLRNHSGGNGPFSIP